MAPGDDPSIPDDDELYRRVSDGSPNMVVVDALSGNRRPSSAAFKPDDDGVSVYREGVLRSRGLSAADLVVQPGNLVVSLPVSAVRALSLGVRNDPWPRDIPDPDHPRNAAHALIVGWDGLGKSARRQRQKALSELPTLRFVFP